MAKATIYFQPQIEGLPDEMKADLIKIATSGPDNPSFKPDLEGNQKRWLIVGICLQSIITPALRTHIEPCVLKLYNSLKHTRGIDKQTFNKVMPGTPSYGFNYEAINNNATLPRIRGREQRFNYNVTNHVDFSKLFLATNMTQFTAFDPTIDLSALLGIIINMDGFSQILKFVAKEEFENVNRIFRLKTKFRRNRVGGLHIQVRSNVRNLWAHCNFNEWDALQYQSAFQKMFQLIRHLNLKASEESELSAELTKWEGNGFQFLQGYALGQEVVTELRKQTCLLIEYVLKKESETEENLSKVHSNLLQIDQELGIACKIIEDIHRDQKNQEEIMGVISGNIFELKTTQHSLEKQLTVTSCEVGDIAKNQDAMRTEQNSTSLRVVTLEEKVHLSDEQLQSMQNDIKGLRNYMSHVRPGKFFFYPPDRPECFVSREQELMFIKYRFNENNNLQYTQVICGLGGCGKTTLSVEFAWRCQEMYPGGVFWMSAESSETLEDSVAQLAINVETIGKNSQETLRKTLRWLSSVSEKWLLVVDNADEETFSAQTKELLFGSWKRGSKGHIIITTRREQKEVENSMFIKKGNILCLYTLECEEGASFLRKRTGFQVSDDDNDDIAAIVNELGGLPLALEQAAAHIKSLGCSFGEYIRRFQKKRLKLLKAMPNITQISQERLTVKTTWQLNIDYICEESKNEGLGTAAKTVMDITSFLFSDDIPIELINIGNPVVEDEDLVDALEDQDGTVGLKQIVEILTRFSLFQSLRRETLSVHRLVQEVIRDSLDVKRKSMVLKMASRMVNFALNHNETPYTILQNDDIRRGALYMWSKIAINANTLKEHLVKVSRQIKSEHDLCFNKETINILQTTAMFHSLHQRQDRALADQEQMCLIIPTLDFDEEEYRKVTAVTIPLQLKDRKRIQECTVLVIHNAEGKSDPKECIIPLDSETLRLNGNDAFMNGKYNEALQYYTEGIRACPENSIDCKILANRSQLYFRTGQYQNALNDANQCIEIEPDHYTAYVSKAYAVAEMIKCGDLPPTWEGVGLASASIAAYMKKACLLKFKMKICYPVVNYVMVDHKDIRNEVLSATCRPFTTFLLRKGRYDLKNIFVTPKSFQLIGVEDGVEIDLGTGMSIQRPSKKVLTVEIEIEKEIQIHFENVSFAHESDQISVNTSCITTFYKCKFSNGKKACDAFPKCRGESGCLNPSKCKDAWQKKITHLLGSNATGQVGYAGLSVTNGGRAYVHSCIFDRCGGGGVLSSGVGSLIEIKNCIVQNMRQMGIEARDGGAIKAEDNVIINNQTHGVAIGPQGFGYVVRNTIQGNGQEGIWCGGILEVKVEGNLEFEGMNSKGGSKATIIDNVISQNGLSGLSFDGGCYYIKGNRIFENWLWGMMVKSRSSCYILNNDIFENKSGGIRVGANYSASVLLDGNTIRDHTGPAVYALYAPIYYHLPELKPTNEINIQVGDDETFQYSRAVMKTNTNVLRNNNKGFQHPKDLVDFIQKCCYCHEFSNKLKQCSMCKKASYCSKDCQTKHVKRHEHICQLLQESFIIEIKMANTKPVTEEKYGEVNWRMFDHKLKGIREGPAPDKTTSKKFIVKIQSGKEYSFYDPHTEMMLYDRSVTLDIMFSNPVLYHLANECGVLAGSKFTTKKIFCWASFKDKGKILCIHTDNLPPFQTW